MGRLSKRIDNFVYDRTSDPTVYGRPPRSEQKIDQTPVGPPSYKIESTGTNHRVHFVLFVLSCGLWLPFWIIAWALNGNRKYTKITRQD